MNNKQMQFLNYKRPEKTYQQTLSNQEIKEKLKDYKKVVNITSLPLGTHIRYFKIDPNTKVKSFRLGGTLTKIDPEGRFITLSNNATSWSVQLATATCFQKMTEDEYKEELKKEVKKELDNGLSSKEDNKTQITELKQEISQLRKQIEYLKNFEKDNNRLIKENNELLHQLGKIKEEILKKKNKK